MKLRPGAREPVNFPPNSAVRVTVTAPIKQGLQVMVETKKGNVSYGSEILGQRFEVDTKPNVGLTLILENVNQRESATLDIAAT